AWRARAKGAFQAHLLPVGGFVENSPDAGGKRAFQRHAQRRQGITQFAGDKVQADLFRLGAAGRARTAMHELFPQLFLRRFQGFLRGRLADIYLVEYLQRPFTGEAAGTDHRANPFPSARRSAAYGDGRRKGNSAAVSSLRPALKIPHRAARFLPAALLAPALFLWGPGLLFCGSVGYTPR